MDIFKRKKRELPPLFTAAELDDIPATDYEKVLEYLVGLSDEEYAKVWKVADIHRKAYQDASAVLGTPNEPVTFIDPPQPSPDKSPLGNDLPFLEDDHDSSASRRQRKAAEKVAKNDR